MSEQRARRPSRTRRTWRARQPVVAAAAAVLVTAAVVAVSQTLDAQPALHAPGASSAPARTSSTVVAPPAQRLDVRPAAAFSRPDHAGAPARPPPRRLRRRDDPGPRTLDRRHWHPGPIPHPPRPPSRRPRPPVPGPPPSPGHACPAPPVLRAERRTRGPRPRRAAGCGPDLPARRAAPHRPAALPGLPRRGPARQRRRRRRRGHPSPGVPGGRPGRVPRRPRHRDAGAPPARGGGVDAGGEGRHQARPRGDDDRRSTRPGSRRPPGWHAPGTPHERSRHRGRVHRSPATP